MPYIEHGGRAEARCEPKTPGELNYAITELAINQPHCYPDAAFHEFFPTTIGYATDYLELVGLSYTSANAVMGVLDCAGRELKRRTMPQEDDPKLESLILDMVERLGQARDYAYNQILVPYEVEKIRVNGDVYPHDVLATKKE